MQITLKQLQRLIREQTPDEALGAANDQNNFSPTQKAAMGFVNDVMGPTPSGDQLAGLESQLQSYANLKGVQSDNLRNAVQKMLPSSGQHPQYQYDAASGAVGSTSGKKVYGEHFKIRITRRQIRRIIKEELFKEAPTPYEREEALRLLAKDTSKEDDPTSWSDRVWWAFASEKGLIDPYDDGHRNVSVVAGLKQRTLDSYNAGENWEDAYVQHF